MGFKCLPDGEHYGQPPVIMDSESENVKHEGLTQVTTEITKDMIVRWLQQFRGGFGRTMFM